MNLNENNIRERVENFEKHIKDNNYENNIPFLIGETYIDNVKNSIYTKVNKREFYKILSFCYLSLHLYLYNHLVFRIFLYHNH